MDRCKMQYGHWIVNDIKQMITLSKRKIKLVSLYLNYTIANSFRRRNEIKSAKMMTCHFDHKSD